MQEKARQYSPTDEKEFKTPATKSKQKVNRDYLPQYEEKEIAEDWDDDLDWVVDDDLRDLQHAQEQAEANYLAHMQECRDDCNEFIEYAFTDANTGADIVQAWFHRELQASFESSAFQYGIYILPRDHGKTTQVEAYAVWRLGNNHNLRIKIVCASDNKAKDRLFTIIQSIEENPKVREVFPDLRPAERGDWTKHKIVVHRDRIMRDASIEALGVTSTATGGRADLLIADDVVDRRNALEQPKLRDTIKVAWNADWMNLLEPEGQLIYICTLWHTADLTHQLLLNPEYKVLRYDINENLDPIWEAHWPRTALEQRKRLIGVREFDRGFRNIALSGDIIVVLPEWIEYWTTPPDLDSLIVFQAHDVSSGESDDYFASVTLGVDPATLIVYVLQARHGMHTFLGQANIVMSLAGAWLPMKVGIEEGPMRALGQYIDETTFLAIEVLKPKISKWLRLSAVTPYMERGRVLFNPALKPENIAEPLAHGSLVTELCHFPLGANDDLVDAFVHAFNLARDWVLEDTMNRAGEVSVGEIVAKKAAALPAHHSEIIDAEIVEETAHSTPSPGQARGTLETRSGAEILQARVVNRNVEPPHNTHIYQKVDFGAGLGIVPGTCGAERIDDGSSLAHYNEGEDSFRCVDLSGNDGDDYAIVGAQRRTTIEQIEFESEED